MMRVISIIVVSATILTLQQAKYSLTVRLLCAPCRFELGSPVRFRVAFGNSGDTPYYVHTTPDVGPSALGVIAERGQCRYGLESQHFDIAPGTAKFGFVPLRPGTTLESDVMHLNDPRHWGQPALPIPGPGEFKVRATFKSEGSDAAGGLFPLWRGAVRSDAVAVTFVQPAETTTRKWRAQLVACRQENCTDSAAIEYFRFVRDTAAADVLIALLHQYPESPSLIPAILHQGRPRDAAELDAFANTKAPATRQREWPAFQEQAKMAATALRSAGACGAVTRIDP